MPVIDSVLPNIELDARVFYHQPFKIKFIEKQLSKHDVTPVGLLLHFRQPI